MFIFSLVLTAGLNARSCWIFPCAYTDSLKFEDKYVLGAPIAAQSPVFKCAERATGIQYVCKFPKVAQDLVQIPAEIAVFEAINESPWDQKYLFAEMHEYFYLDRSYFELPKGLISSNFLKLYFEYYTKLDRNNYRTIPERYKIYVEVIKLYDGNWVNGIEYVTRNPDRTEKDVITIFTQLAVGIKYLYTLGYSHSDIKRNEISN